MQTQTRIFVFSIVTILGLVVCREYLSAQGEPAKPAATVGKYQISSWGGATFAEGKMKVASGAYILDSETGNVYSLENNGAPHLLGAIPKK
jgi:hypothetical protein